MKRLIWVVVLVVWGNAELKGQNSLAGNAIQTDGPDLIVLGIKSRSRMATGAGYLATNTIHNLGRSGVTRPFTVGLYFSHDEFITTNDIRFWTISISDIGAESTITGVGPIAVPQTVPPGTYYLGAIVDPNGIIHEVNDSNNALASHFVEVVIGPDLVVSAVNGPSRAGTTTTIAITNRVHNVGSGVASGVTVGLYLSVDAIVDTNDLLLASRVTDVAALFDNIEITQGPIPNGLPSGSYFLGGIVDVHGVTPELNEANNTLSHPIEIVAGPDLVVTAFSGPGTGQAGSQISIQSAVQNSGADDVRSAFEVGFYLSTDGLVTTADVLLGSRTIATLGGGQTDSQASTLTLDVLLRSGSYYIAAIADHRQQAIETAETNNASGAQLIQITSDADLAMRTVTGPASAVTGQEITLGDMVENIGTGRARTFSVAFYLSEDPEITTNDLRLVYRIIFTLGAGQSSSAATTAFLQHDLAPGAYHLGAIADFSGIVEDSDRSNNVLTGTQIQIGIGPDIELVALHGPSRAGTATLISVTNTVRNAGTGTTPAFPVHFYLSTDAEITTNDLLLGSRSFANGLAPGTNSSQNTQLLIPTGLSGTFYLGAIADPAGVVVESSEANNVLVAGLMEIVPGPDLVITQLEAPSNAVTGGQILISNTVFNAGEAALTGPFEVAFFLSTDPLITPQDMRMGSRTNSGLGAQEASIETTVVRLDPLLHTGNYYLGAIVDPNGQITEVNRTNNTSQGIEIHLGPGTDLILTSVSGPVSAFTGRFISLQDTLSNIGAGHSRACSITFYLSLDEMVTTNDLRIGQRLVLEGVAAGQSSSGSTMAFLGTALPPGNYFLGALADYSNIVEESNEDNNASPVYAFELRAGPDLEITALGGPIRAGTATSISVSNTARNSGSGLAPAFGVSFYLSADGEISGGDLLLASRSLPNGLAPNENNAGTTILTIPIGVVPGNYWLAAKADGAEQIAEGSELNNVRLQELQILEGPDLVVTEIQGPTTGLSGDSMTVSVVARNSGMFETTTNFNLAVYLLADIPVPSTPLKVGQGALSGLMAGESRSLNVQASLSGVLSGNYYLRAVIDDGLAVAEADENNNTLTGSLITVSAGVITSIRRNGADILVSFATLAGQIYRLERTVDAGDSTSWTIVPGASYLNGNGGTIEVTDQGAAGLATVFYRTRLMH